MEGKDYLRTWMIAKIGHDQEVSRAGDKGKLNLGHAVSKKNEREE